MAASPVPLIDLEPFRTGDDAVRRAVAAQVDAACRDVGFLAVTGHGVPAELIAELQAVGHEFFALPDEVKRSYIHVPRHGNRGYTELGGEALAYAMDEVAPPDLFEAFTTGPILDTTDAYFHEPEAHDFFVPNVFPTEPARFEQVWKDYYRANERLAADLMAVFALALDLPIDFFDATIDRHLTAQRIIRYPALHGEPEPGQLRIAPHSDYGSLTILLTDGTPGLQIQDPSGAWLDVPPAPDAFIVNIGDLMADWTNDRWRSTVHRVLPVALDRDRYSATFFHHPNYDALIEPIASCVDADHPPRHDPVTAGDHLRRKLVAQVL